MIDCNDVVIEFEIITIEPEINSSRNHDNDNEVDVKPDIVQEQNSQPMASSTQASSTISSSLAIQTVNQILIEPITGKNSINGASSSSTSSSTSISNGDDYESEEFSDFDEDDDGIPYKAMYSKFPRIFVAEKDGKMLLELVAIEPPSKKLKPNSPKDSLSDSGVTSSEDN